MTTTYPAGLGVDLCVFTCYMHAVIGRYALSMLLANAGKVSRYKLVNSISDAWRAGRVCHFHRLHLACTL
jgi:hypothetical protein